MWTTVGIAVLLGTSDTQNAAFLVALLAVVVLLVALHDRNRCIRSRCWRSSLRSRWARWSSTTRRTCWHNVRMGRTTRSRHALLANKTHSALRPAHLLLPVPGHRIGAFASLAADAADAQSTDGESGGTSLGLVGGVGLIVSIGAVALVAVGARRRRRSSQMLADLGVLNLAAILIGTVGGGGFLLALGGLTQYRTWNRISLYIAFASLLAVAVLLEQAFAVLHRRLRTPHVANLIVGAVAVVLIVGGTYDQIPPKYVPDYATLAARFDQDATFYHSLEHRLPRDAMVFQLPVAQFPEIGPIVNMPDYAEFAAYLHTDHLRWSYGGMKGRPDADWIRNLASCDPRQLVTQIAVAGFGTAVLDTRGYADGAVSFLDAVRPLVGPPRSRSGDGHLVELDLTALRSRLRNRVPAATVRTWRDTVLNTSPAWNDFSSADQSCEGARRWSTAPDASLTFTNSTGHPQRIVVATDLEAATTARSITARGPGFSSVVPLAEGRGRLEQPVELPVGTSTVRFHETGPQMPTSPDDPRTLWFSLHNATFDPPGAPTLAAWAASPAAE